MNVVALEYRKHVSERGFQLCEPVFLGGDEELSFRTEQVSLAPAERQAPVGRALAVGGDAAPVVESLPLAQADLVPDGFGQRFSGDHHGVERDQPPLVAGERVRVALGGADYGIGRNRAPGGGGRIALNVEYGRGFEYAHAAPAYGFAEAAHQARRVDGRAMGRVDGAVVAGAVDAPPGLFGRQPVAIVGKPARGVGLCLRLQAPDGERRVCDRQRSALGVVTVDVLRLADAGDFIHGGHHAAQHARAGIARRGVREQVLDARGGAHAPAAVAAAGAETDGRCFQDGDVEVGLQDLEVIGRPQAGESAADDGDIDPGGQFLRRVRFRGRFQ